MPTLKFKLAVKYGFYSYVATFVLGYIYALIAGIDMTTTVVPTSVWIGGMIITAITVGFFGWKYLKRFPCPSVVTGAMFGVITILLSFLVDVVFFVIGKQLDATRSIIEYYGNPFFFGTLLVAFLAPAIVAHYAFPRKR